MDKGSVFGLIKGKWDHSIKGKDISFLNPYSYILVRKNQTLLEGLDVYLIDGAFLCMALRLFMGKVVERVSFDMTSLAPIIFKDASENENTIYFVGSKQEEIDDAIKQIKDNYPQLKIPRYRNGYFNGDEREQELARLVEEAPDIVVVGMGTPLQEQFLIDLRSRGWKGTGFTCGGFLHQTAKGIQYYPKWMDKLNLRWLYRIYDEPKLFKRYTVDYSKFVFLFLYDVARYRLSKN